MEYAIICLYLKEFNFRWVLTFSSSPFYSKFEAKFEEIPINIFLRKSIMEGGIPFDMKQQYFNAETETAIQEARDIITGKTASKSYRSARELFEELDKEMDGEEC